MGEKWWKLAEQWQEAICGESWAERKKGGEEVAIRVEILGAE